MSSTQELVNEVNRLRVELKERCIQIDALHQFEEEISLQFKDILSLRDSKIKELEGRVEDLSLSNTTSRPQDNSEVLMNLLNEREQEVMIMEEKVRQIMSERDEMRLRESISDSIVDYEHRVEGLRHELIGKDSEIRQLRSLLEQLPSPSGTPAIEVLKPDNPPPPQAVALSLVRETVFSLPPPVPSVAWEEVVALRRKLEETLENAVSLRGYLAGRKLFFQLENEQEEEAKDLKFFVENGDVSSLKIILVEIETALCRKSISEEFQRIISDLEKQLTDLRSLEKERETRFSVTGSPPLPLEDKSMDGIAARLKEEVKNRRKVEELNDELKLRLEDRELENEIRMKDDLIRKLRRENQELVRAIGSKDSVVGNGLCLLSQEIDQLRGDLRVKEAEVKDIRVKFIELKKEVRQKEQELEARNLVSLKKKQQPKEDPLLKEEVVKLQKEIESIKLLPPARVKRKVERKWTVATMGLVSFFSRDDTVKKMESKFDQIGIIRGLQNQLTQAEDELLICKRKLEVDAKLELELERLRFSKLEADCIASRTRLEEAEYQIRKGDQLARQDDAVLQVQLELRRVDSELSAAQESNDAKSIENVRLRSKLLELEIEKTWLVRKAQRAVDERDVVVKMRTNGGDEEKIFFVSTTKLEEEVVELRKQRDQDRAAIAEAEKVLSLVEQTEAKYLKVARENAKLRKDISALNDDTFWTDLESLQSQHKVSVSLLRQCRERVTDQSLLALIEDLVGPPEVESS